MTEAASTGSASIFCDDCELGYRRSLTDFSVPLTLDDSYRLAHLPLVAPNHPRVIPRMEGKFYETGRHPPVFSLVLPVRDEALRGSAAFLALEAEIKAAPFAAKIAWDILPRRKDRLHATVCGSLGTGVEPAIAGETRRRYARPRLSPSNCAACSRATSIVAGSILPPIRKNATA